MLKSLERRPCQNRVVEPGYAGGTAHKQQLYTAASCGILRKRITVSGRYFVSGGWKRGRAGTTAGIPTANIRMPEGVLTLPGRVRHQHANRGKDIGA